MPAPLDPVIAQIIPLLPLRDPKTMTPQSCREALRALSDARKAAAPPPPVASAEDITVKGAAGPLAARVYRTTTGKAPTVVFFHGGGWVAGDLETHDRQTRWLAIETGAVGNFTQRQLEGLAGETLQHGEGLADGGDVVLRILLGIFRCARCRLCAFGHLECLP